MKTITLIGVGTIKVAHNSVAPLILKHLSPETPRTVRDLIRLTDLDYTTIIRCLRHLRKRNVIYSVPTRLFGHTSLAGQLNYYLNG